MLSSPTLYPRHSTVIAMIGKESSTACVKDGQADFIQDHCDWGKVPCSGVFGGGETGLNSEDGLGKRGFLAKGQGQRMGTYEEETSG